MNSSENQVKRLTVDDIDPELVEEIRISDYFLENTNVVASTQQDREYVLAVLLHLANNPIVPSDDDTSFLYNLRRDLRVQDHRDPTMASAMIEWQRLMFRRKPAALPDEVKSLLLDESPLISEHSRPTRPFYNSAVLKAYKLGKEGK